MGGTAVYGAALVGWLILAWVGQVPWALFLGASLLFVVGLVDDLRGVTPGTKLIAQIAAAALLVLAGYRIAPDWPLWLSYCVTFVWVIGITNALNLLDNMDGLAAGVAGIAGLSVAAFAALAGHPEGVGIALVFASAAFGFLLYNFNPARIFMGDSGSLFLGYAMAALPIVLFTGSGAAGVFAVILVPAAVMAVPILDTTLVTVKRIASGRSVSQGGRDHTSHRLVSLGLSERRAVLTLYAVSTLFGMLALGFHYFEVYLIYAIAMLAVVALAVFGIFLANAEVYGPEVERLGRPRSQGQHQRDHVILRAVLRSKRQLAGMLADLLLVIACFLLAHYLRFEGTLADEVRAAVIQAIPVVVVLKISTFYVLGLYRGILRYAGSHEIIRVARASILASALSVGALVMLYRFDGYSRSLFVIDWLLTTVTLVGVRVAFRGLRQYFAGKRIGGRRVILYGAGDAGSLALREIRQNPALGLIPLGFVDDDPAKQGLVMEGLPVLGGGEDLLELLPRYGIDEVIVTISRFHEGQRASLLARLERSNVAFRELQLAFEAPVEAELALSRPKESVVA
jgi:UDP-GlcNAc:undecaprenyl-phosphate GlcNAc-1-phosphate transferase